MFLGSLGDRILFTFTSRNLPQLSKIARIFRKHPELSQLSSLNSKFSQKSHIFESTLNFRGAPPLSQRVPMAFPAFLCFRSLPQNDVSLHSQPASFRTV